ncbi:MAG: cysteine desulfurase [Ignavibacteria bacterium]|nr:cysteine desulfurase [Ignavibacteria bacterium]
MDNNATTKVDERVFEAMKPFFLDNFANPASSSHLQGLTVQRIIEQKRGVLADLFGTIPNGIIFTGSATESINTVIKGVIENSFPEKRHIIVSEIEHNAVYEILNYLSPLGVQFSVIPVDSDGFLDIQSLETAILPETALISIIGAQNEIGTLQNLDTITQICQSHKVPLHIDYTQAAGKISVNLQNTPIDFLTIGAHKNHGPKGVGALLATKPIKSLLPALIHGGGQESGIRGGTLNVPLIVGLVECMEIGYSEAGQNYSHLRILWNLLYDKLVAGGDFAYLNGPVANRLYSNFNFFIPGVKVEAVKKKMPKVAFSSSSACSTEKSSGSHVLKAIGKEPNITKNSIRFGLSKFTTREEIEYTILLLKELRKD